MNSSHAPFNSVDNLLTDPYLGEFRASFSARNPVGTPYPGPYSFHSSSVFPPSRDVSNSVEWGRPSIHLVGSELFQHEEIEKKESDEKKRTESPSFFGNMFSVHPSHSPIPYGKEDTIESRKSNLSGADLECGG